VVAKLPRPVADFIIRVSAIHDAFATSSKTYPSPPVTMPVFASHIATLTTAETAVKTRAAGTVADRDAARKAVVIDVGLLQGYAQQAVNADPANADALAQDAGMTVRKSTRPAKPPLAAKPASTGAVHLVAKAIKGGKSNEWQYSADGGKTWVSVPSSTQAKTSITGLQVGALVSFRHRAVTKAGPQDWSQVISATVT